MRTLIWQTSLSHESLESKTMAMLIEEPLLKPNKLGHCKDKWAFGGEREREMALIE
jgi:hypothetical protein